MKYQTEHGGEIKTTNKIILVDGDTTYRIEREFGEIVVTKINFDDSTICVKPKVSNQISFK